MLKRRIYRSLTVVMAAVLAALSFGQVIGRPHGTPAKQFTPPKYPDAFVDRASRTLNVGFKTAADMQSFSTKVPSGAQVLMTIPRINVVTLIWPTSAGASAELPQIKRLHGVRFAQFDQLAKVTGFPNDPFYKQQWAHQRTSAFAAWGVTQGDPSVTVAILDTGLDLSHPEFAGRIVDPMTTIVGGTTVFDGNSHGTHCSGIATAKGNNGIGVAGVSWHSMLMPVKCMHDEGFGFLSEITAGIVAATDAGANVISMSIGGYALGDTVDPMYSTAIDYALAHNTLVVAAAGNESTNLDTVFQQYGVTEEPGGYAPVLTVAASDVSNQLAFFSNFGKKVDVVAPGDNILSTFPGGYGLDSGTSMACPYIAGTAALVFSVGGTTMTPAQVTSLITGPASYFPTGCNKGLVNVFASVLGAPAKASYDITPTNVSIVYGTLSGGSAGDLDAVDGSFMKVDSTNISLYGPTVIFDATYDTGDLSGVTSLKLSDTLKADGPVDSTIQLWDFTKLKWVPFAAGLANTTLTTLKAPMYQSDMAKYIDSNGVLKVRYTGTVRLRRFGSGNSTNFSVSTDGQGINLIY